MFIEGLGEKEISEGTFTYVPRGVKHSLIEVVEPITILNRLRAATLLEAPIKKLRT